MIGDVRETLWESGLTTSTTQGKTAQRTYLCKVTAGPSTGRQVALGARAIVIGAERTCDLVLDDPKVSRRHTEIRADPDGLHVRDLDSKNGTFIEGVRITDAVTPSTASIRCGDSVIRVSRQAAPTVPPSARARFGALVGESLAMREVFAVLELAAPTDATVLIQGESGSGKELAARGIHDHSPRAQGPFVVVDCSAANVELIESQLFGHRKGSYTGAVAERKGAFVEAHNGTLFLDELGELPLPAQAKLLRALEERSVQALGADHPTTVDARVVAATNRDLSSMVEAKTFRFDLFHRVSVVHIGIPPLRHRLDDLPCLIRHFYEGRNVDPGPIDGENLELLQRHAWPGNVRELRNTLERAFVLSGGKMAFRALRIWLETESVTPYDVVDTTLDFKQAKERWVSAFERRYLATVFAQHGRNISRAAAHAGINRRHFRKLLIDHGLRDSAGDLEGPDNEGG
jgi:two-component system, NtrC family, response regulator HydG